MYWIHACYINGMQEIQSSRSVKWLYWQTLRGLPQLLGKYRNSRLD
jgi:hypothetical protein